jgi:DNA-binding protein H-NS
MARGPRRRRITPLDATEIVTSHEREETGEVNAPDKPGSSEEVGEPTETQDTESSLFSDNEYEGEDAMTALNIETASEDELVSAIRDVLDRLSLEGLVTVIDFAQERRSTKQEEARTELLEEFRNRAAAIGMSLEGLLPNMGGGTRRRSAGTIAAKYRGPQGELYSGRGVPPKWMQALIGSGHAKGDFFIGADGMTEWERQQKTAAA